MTGAEITRHRDGLRSRHHGVVDSMEQEQRRIRLRGPSDRYLNHFSRLLKFRKFLPFRAG